MLIDRLRTLALVTTAGAFAFTAVPVGATTLTLGSPAPQGVSDYAGIELAATKKEKRADNRKKKRWAYNRHNHGPRYRHRTTVYKYYYGGYYYSQPWWTIAVPGIVIRID